jgi:hypothetical protein
MIKQFFISFYAYIIKYLFNFIELQLVITLLSLPILICWGLPISCMFLISNLIFTPLLIIFLWLSTIFACCSLMNIPCSLIIWSIHQITILWMWLLSFSKPTWLLGFSLKMLIPSCVIVTLVFIVYSQYKLTSKQSITFLSSCLCTLLIIRTCIQYPSQQQIADLPLIALHAYGKNYLIDCGALCKKQNFYNHLDYTIIPELIKKTSMTTIDTLVLCKPSKRLAKVALQCCKQLNISTIIAPQKFDCFKVLQLTYKNSKIRILPLTKQKTSK